MTKRSLHDILAAIHQLLASTNADDLRQASKYAGASSNMRIALEALAAEVEATGANYSFANTSKKHGQKSNKRQAIGRRSPPKRSYSNSQLLVAMEQSSRLENKAALREAIRRFGLPVTIRTKDSRREVVKKVLTATKQLPEDRRREFLEYIFPESDSQTAGWIEVITGSK